jgi:hypothetical protein
MHDIAVARDQYLGVGQLARVDVSLLQQRIDPGEAKGIETMGFRPGDGHALIHTPASKLIASYCLEWRMNQH